MRRPFGTGAFDYVFNLFTNFGYFEDPAENLIVVRNMARALRTGGRLVPDYLNVRHAEAHLNADETIERDGVVYRISRWTDSSHIFKRIAIDDGCPGKPLEPVNPR